MNRIRSIAAAALLAALTVPGTAPTVRADAAQIVFTAAEKAIIAEFYGGAGARSGSGKPNKGGGQGAGNQRVPPGLAKKQTLPPGIAKRQLPAALASRLPAPPDGFERVIVGADVLLVEIATQVVHDVLTHIVTR